MNQFKKEVRRFLVAGFSAVATDLMIYYFLSHFISHSLAKGVSFLSGTIVAFGLNKYWTFESHAKSWNEAIRFGLLYLSTLGINVVTNFFCLNIIFHQKALSFCFATAMSTICNFIGQKMWVFRQQK